MAEEKDNLIELFKEANQDFLDGDKNLFLTNVNERTLCGALAQHLRSVISCSKYWKYYVDVEYNRNNGKIKTIIGNEFEVVTINCDIIVHSRGEILGKDNLIAVEMKKSNAPEAKKQKDKIRLIALTKESYDNVWSNDGKTFPEHVCGYALGIYYEVNVNNKNVLLEYFVKGNFAFRETLGF